MNQNLIAKATVNIAAARYQVWDALVTPAAIKQYMFGTNVESDWEVGSPITWKGEWQGRAYEDKGVVLQFKPERMLQYSHFSPLSGEPDIEENYHTVTIELLDSGAHTRVVLTQDKNATEEARAHSQQNWELMLQGLKKYVENS
jgi:uncharacterized protein YndB with AHSA1/START domain